jgi:hypothetical protein
VNFIIIRTYPEYRYIIEYCKTIGVGVRTLDNMPPSALPLAFNISEPLLGYTDSLNRAVDFKEFAEFIADIAQQNKKGCNNEKKCG